MSGLVPATAQTGPEPVLAQALAWLGRPVGFDAARALAYGPRAMIAVGLAAADRLDWDTAVSASWNGQAETDTHRGVLDGLSTRQISTRLHITAYTVQDQLRAIFTKLGVTSQGRTRHHLTARYS
jgi:DNA-binding CsgD family transcriptional regulator